MALKSSRVNKRKRTEEDDSEAISDAQQAKKNFFKSNILPPLPKAKQDEIDQKLVQYIIAGITLFLILFSA